MADLSLYPILDAGNYRLAKPFFNAKTKKAYVCYYDFELTKAPGTPKQNSASLVNDTINHNFSK